MPLLSYHIIEKSSACVDVMIGSLCDPKEAQGLAYFLEHKLIMGTTKYPIENEYSSYLSSHGGYSNAYTSQENTVYYFDVQPDHLEGALDRFAAFFTCPLLSDSSTSREVNAVDSENTKNLQVDSWRKFQLLKSLARDDHPLSSFSTGEHLLLRGT
jgi:insulysin